MAKTSFLIFLLCDQFQSAKYSRLFDLFSKYKTKCLLASLGHDFIIVRKWPRKNCYISMKSNLSLARMTQNDKAFLPMIFFPDYLHESKSASVQ